MLFKARKKISLALQGGGSHGAFTWGVLDRLLEEPHLRIDGISGASAGAMNGVVLAHGLTTGGREGARQALGNFWRSVAARMPFDPLESWAPGSGHESDAPLSMRMLLAFSRYFSPYELNPFALNPLREILTEQVDFQALRRQRRIRLFIATTQVRTGMLRLFERHQLSVEVLLASACLPSIHHAVEIDGEAYWDGGYSANPAIFPLLLECRARDLVMVLLHPAMQPDYPRTAGEIVNRVTELGFNAPFLREMQTLALAKREAERVFLPTSRLERRLRGTHFHLIEADELMVRLSSGSKLNAHLGFLEFLFEQGRQRASQWLAQNAPHIAVRSSVNLAKVFATA